MAAKDLSLVQTFKRVIETRSFRIASEDLSMMPSSISRQISKLEDMLGVPLLVRTTRHVHPTEAGLAFYEQCAAGIGEIEAAWDAVSRFRTEPQGLLRVRATPCFGQRHIVQALAEFVALFPRVTVDLSLEHATDGFMEYGIDVQIQGSTVGSSKKLASKNLTTMPHIVCAAKSFMDAHGEIQTPMDLARVNCLINRRSDVQGEWPFVYDGQPIAVSVKGNFSADNLEAIYKAALLGMGVARLPHYLAAPDLQSGRLVRAFRDSEDTRPKPRFSASSYTMRAYFDRDRLKDAKVEKFVDFLVARFVDYDWILHASLDFHDADDAGIRSGRGADKQVAP